MIFAPARRQLLLALAAFAVSPRPARAAQDDPIATLERRHGGRLGVFALDIGTGRTLAHRADERFMLFSTFKGLLAAEVLAAVAAGEDSLDAPVPYTAADLLPASPITSAHVGERTLTVGALCLAIMHQSDTAAANLLLRRRGGPQALTAFPGDRAAGDRTGTGDGYCNDDAIARRPGRAPLLVSAYYEAHGQKLLAQEAVMRAVGAAIVAWQA